MYDEKSSTKNSVFMLADLVTKLWKQLQLHKQVTHQALQQISTNEILLEIWNNFQTQTSEKHKPFL